MENNTQARKWALVINNPLGAGLDHAAIREILYRFSDLFLHGGRDSDNRNLSHAYFPVFSLAHALFHGQKPFRHGAY